MAAPYHVASVELFVGVKRCLHLGGLCRLALVYNFSELGILQNSVQDFDDSYSTRWCCVSQAEF